LFYYVDLSLKEERRKERGRKKGKIKGGEEERRLRERNKGKKIRKREGKNKEGKEKKRSIKGEGENQDQKGKEKEREKGSKKEKGKKGRMKHKMRRSGWSRSNKPRLLEPVSSRPLLCAKNKDSIREVAGSHILRRQSAHRRCSFFVKHQTYNHNPGKHIHKGAIETSLSQVE